MAPKQQQQYEEAGISSQASDDLANTHVMISKISEQSSRRHEKERNQVRAHVHQVCEKYTTGVADAISKHESRLAQEYTSFRTDEQQVNKEIEQLLASLHDDFNAAQGTIEDNRGNVYAEWNKSIQKAQRALQGFQKLINEESHIVEQTETLVVNSDNNARNNARGDA